MNIKQLFGFIAIVCVALATTAQTKKRASRQEYINMYAGLAIKEMKRVGIPASITLAQGSLESDNGNSDLAVEANNHFGIKCHKEWTGKKYFKDDDEKNECFRVYEYAEQSYDDHSEFLKTRDRYAFLFTLDPLDYKAWARGLKKAGYATNPNYPELLIKIIEDNKLYEYDTEQRLATGHAAKKPRFDPRSLPAPPRLADIDSDFEVVSPVRQVLSNNARGYIVVKQKDSFESIAREHGLSRWQLLRYNDLTRDSSLRAGQVIYIQAKRGKAEKKYPAHMVRKGENLHAIAQLYGIKLRKLARRNNMKRDEKLVVGSQLILR